MIWLPVVLNLPLYRYDLLLVDEAQDLNRCQQALAKRAGKRLVLVGDCHQCHPAGTMVTKTGGENVPVESLQVGDMLVSFNPCEGRIVGLSTQGRRVQGIACRDYSGPLYNINGTRCTPNHKWPTKFTDSHRSSTALYLMELEDGSFRIGQTQLMLSRGNGFGPALRARQEGGIKVWLLDIFVDREEAREQEFKNSIRFQVPQRAQYEESSDSWPLELIKEGVHPDINGLLDRYGREYQYPIWERGQGQHVGTKYAFTTQACNLVPGVSMIATRVGETVAWVLSDIQVTPDWTGKVWSLSVQPTERDHRLYIADDNIVSNSIYGFAGADSDSIPRMIEELGAQTLPYDLDHTAFRGRGCTVLPLTVTRRCGKAIVEEARQFVPEFSAHGSNPEGLVRTTKYNIQGSKENRRELAWEECYLCEVRAKDFILCRCNAPLVSACFKFIKRGIRANIQGRDIGKGLVSTVKKLCKDRLETPVAALVGLLSDWLANEQAKEQAERFPSEAKLQGLQDRHDCLYCFIAEAQTAQDVINKIEAVFTGDKESPGIKLSSIHKAKGLEAKRVFILRPPQCGPNPENLQAWELEQERNLEYVAITRSIEELVYVR